MKQLKPFLKNHRSGSEAIQRTKKNNVIAVRVNSYSGERLVCIEFFSYKTKFPYNLPNGEMQILSEDFPQPLGSNQSIEEIDANDY